MWNKKIFPFIPFYVLGSVYVIFLILLWLFLGFEGTEVLPANFWFFHELIFGFSPAILVGFLLTSVENWSKIFLKEAELFTLCFFWLLARFLMFWANATFFAFATEIIFLILSAAFLAQPIFLSRNYRSYVFVALLLYFAAADCDFFLQLNSLNWENLNKLLLAGLLGLFAFMGLVISRLFPFLIAQNLGINPVQSPELINYSALNLPICAAFFEILDYQNASALFLFSSATMALIQIYRWFRKEIIFNPLLKILFLAYLLGSLGLILLSLRPFFILGSVSIQILGFATLGFFNLALMVLTSLDYQRIKIYPIFPFWLIQLSCLFGLVSFLLFSTIFYNLLIKLSALCFISSLSYYLYFFIYKQK